MIKITCTSCQKPLSLDETKLPMKEVSFPCPVCKTKLTVDRRNLEMANAAAAAPASEAHPAETAAEDEDAFGAKALIVGNDHPALRQAAKLLGFVPMHFAEARQARDYFMQEFPPVVMLNPSQLTPPPLEALAPIISLMPQDRRKSFFILVAENLLTLLVLAAVWAMLRAARSSHPYRWIGAAGVLTGLATLSHVNGAVLFLPLTFAAWRLRRSGQYR